MSEIPLRGIGFWFHPRAPSDLPRPQAVADHDWNADERRAVLRHLRAGQHFATYRGWSWCRFACGVEDESIGHAELTDGVWVWPEGLAHYVEDHDVELPREFIDHAVRAAPPVRSTNAIDLDWWIQWGKDRGAWVDWST